jgi:hypothetical protein
METRHCLSDHSVIQDPVSGSRLAKPQSGAPPPRPGAALHEPLTKQVSQP